MTYLMLGVLAVTLATAFRPGGDLLSPSRVYLCVYATLLSLYYLGLSRLQTPWSATTNLLFYGASATYLAGGAWVWLMSRARRPAWSLDFARLKTDLAANAATVDWRWFGKVYAFSVAAYLVSFLVSLAIVGGIPAFMENPDEARIDFFGATQLTNYGIFFGPISLMLGVVMLVFSRPDRRARRLILLSMGLVILLYLTIVTRYDLFRFLIFSIVVYHYGRRQMRPVHILGIFAAAAFLFLLGFLVRVNTATIDTFNEMIQVKMPRELAWASNIYAYLANDFWNFDFAVKRYVDGEYSYPLQWGMGLFRALLWQLRIEPALVEVFRFDTLYNERATMVRGLNTVVYVWHFYKDFGVLGALLLPLLGSLLAWMFYQNTLFAPTVFRVAVWGVMVGGIALSYHTPLWELWFLYLNLIVLAVAHRKVRAL